MPELNSLFDYWKFNPPSNLVLRHIAAVLGVSYQEKPKEMPADDLIKQMISAGLPMMNGRPNDPMLDLLDD